LLQRASDLEEFANKSIHSEHTNAEIPLKLSLDARTVSVLQLSLRQAVFETQALTELQKAMHTGSESVTKSTPLIERLGSYPEGKVDLHNLVTYPAKLAPVPVKPLFFDVAWQHIQYPGDKKAGSAGTNVGKAVKGKAEEETKTAGKRGWFGFGGGGS
jgi:signal recognition particle subunit SRP68